MNINRYRQLIEETARRLKEPRADDLLVGTFPEQRTFLLDPARLKAAHCSRGAAKSYTAGIGIYRTMMTFPGCSTFYVTKVHDMARNIMWGPVMKELDRVFRLKVEFNETLLEGRMSNGSTFRLTGIDGDRRQQDKLLGGKYKLVVLDEVAFFETDLTSIVYRVLVPAVGRIDGSIWQMSTSSDYPRGLFFDITNPDPSLRTPGWSVHEWQWWHNPYVKEQLEKVRQELIEANPLIVETNHYKQHWENKWTIDESKLCYKFNAARNLISVKEWNDIKHSLHPGQWARVLGGDTGWEDANALVMTAYHLNDKRLFVPKSFAENHLTFDRFADVIEGQFMRDVDEAPSRVIIDGANKQGVESMKERYSIPFEYADKRDKATFIELFNADLVQGLIKLVDTPENQKLVKEMCELLWATENGVIKYPKKEQEGLANHRCDALLYAWRMGYHFHSAPAAKKIVKYSKEWYDAQAVEIWQKERERLMIGAQGGDWPDQGDWPDALR
jgi:hypothetical protein